jgi:hypothetical protein
MWETCKTRKTRETLFPCGIRKVQERLSRRDPPRWSGRTVQGGARCPHRAWSKTRRRGRSAQVCEEGRGGEFEVALLRFPSARTPHQRSAYLPPSELLRRSLGERCAQQAHTKPTRRRYEADTNNLVWTVRGRSPDRASAPRTAGGQPTLAYQPPGCRLGAVYVHPDCKRTASGLHADSTPTASRQLADC